MTNFQPSAYQIISALDRLGIKREGDQPNHKGWLSILCPNHNDKNFGSCSINLISGFVKCFVCHYGDRGSSRKSIVNLVQDRMGLDYKGAKQFIEEGLFTSCNQIIIEDKPKKRNRVKSLYNFTSVDLDSTEFYYTQQRGFTEEFIKNFNIRRVVSGWFNDYFVIPIIDSSKGINEYEGRKLREYEVLCDFYNVENAPYKKLKDNFHSLCEINKIRLNRKTYQVYIDDQVINDERLIYLLKPKTLYIPNSRCQETIWNIDNLKYDEPLYVTEGISSICKLWTHISKNSTAIFGVSITPEQIEYLKKFKQIIYIPDFDKAGYDSVDFLKKYLDNLFICNIQYEDTDEQYTESIKNAKLLTPAGYIVKYAFTFKFVR
jgi:hypothetical protein